MLLVSIKTTNSNINECLTISLSTKIYTHANKRNHSIASNLYVNNTHSSSGTARFWQMLSDFNPHNYPAHPQVEDVGCFPTGQMYQALIHKVFPQTILGAFLEECHRHYTLNTSYVDFEKKVDTAYSSCYKSLNISSTSHSPHHYSGSQNQWHLLPNIFVKCVCIVKLAHVNQIYLYLKFSVPKYHNVLKQISM